MSIAANAPYTVKKTSDDSVVAQGVTNSEGTISLNLPPDEYYVEFGAYSGYTFEKASLLEPGAALVEDLPNPVLNVTITEDSTTVVNANFIKN